MKEITNKDLSMEMDFFNGQMDLFIKENLLRTGLKDKEITNGQMGEFTKDNGKITRCTVLVSSAGQMGENISGNIKTIKSTGNKLYK